MHDTEQLAYPLEVPLIADSVDSPIVEYGGEMTAIHFTTNDNRWGRITFERLDSLKICRGEHEPYPSDPKYGEDYHWVNLIANSAWLRERYEYEKKHYGRAYNFNGNVDEMLHEYSHYLFSFHDQYVEAIAAGIWFESADEILGARLLPEPHPLNGLAHLNSVDRFESSGITCFVRRNPLPFHEIECRAKLCSQTIYEIGAELEGTASVSWTVTYRVKEGVAKSYLRGYFGNPVETYQAIPSLTDIRPRIDQWLAEVRERRSKMGK